jgi:hypothetical protein
MHSNVVQRVSKYFIDLNNTGIWWYFTLQSLLFYFLLFLIFILVKKKTLESEKWYNHILRSNWTFIAFALIFILASKVPHAVEGMLNPDEAQWVAIAKTVNYDPRFWISVDTGTGGPLVPLSLLIIKVFNFPIDQGSIKIWGAFILGIATCLLFGSFSRVMGSLQARVLILPLIIAFSFLESPDFIAFNSEHIVILFITMSLIFLFKVFALPNPKKYNLVLLGLTLGFVPLAKLQGAPIAAVIGLAACYLTITKYKPMLRPLVLLLGCSILPILLSLIAVWLYGGLHDFYTSYIQQNLLYTVRTTVASPVGDRLMLLSKILLEPADTRFFLHYCFVCSLFGVLWILGIGRKLQREHIEKIMFGVILFAVTCYCIMAPNNDFVHYGLLALIPGALLVSLTINVSISLLRGTEIMAFVFENNAIKVCLIITFIFLTSFQYFQSRFNHHPAYLSKINEHSINYAPHEELTLALKNYFSPGSKMAIWGWTSSLYETTDFLMGTRDAVTPFQIEKIPLQHYYIERYILDLQKNKPLLFVETVAPNFFAYHDRSIAGYENFPLIKKFIDENYTYDTEIGGARIFTRKDYSYKNSFKPNRQPNLNDEFKGNLDEMGDSRNFIVFNGWAALGENINTQNVEILLTTAKDTLAIYCSRYERQDVAIHFKNDNWLISGFKGYALKSAIPPGEYNVNIYVRNKRKEALINLNKTINTESH